MRDMSHLRGASVRTKDGRQGRVENVSAPWVKLNWFTPGSAPQTQCLLRSDPSLDEEIDVLTTDRAWIPLGDVLGTGRLAQEMREHRELRAIGYSSFLDEARASMFGMSLSELKLSGAAQQAAAAKEKKAKLAAADEAETKKKKKKKGSGGKMHNPWKRKKSRGPTSGVAKNPRKDSKTGEWSCSYDDKYSQDCTNNKTGEKKLVVIDKEYKRKYNQKYRAAGYPK